MLTSLICKLAFFKDIVDALSNKFKVGKFLVGVSVTESLPSPAAIEKLFGVKLLELPLVSFPNVVAVVPEFSANCSLKPFVPKVNPYVLIGTHCPVVAFVSPKDDGVNCCPSI